MIRLCDKCKSKAVWMYMPKDNRYYCEEHVSRGCSCNLDPDTGEEDKDDQGRLLPCCEYDYSEKGFRIENNV